MGLFYKNIRYIFWVYLAGLVVFFLFRLIFLCVHWEQVRDISGRFGLLSRSFLMGLRFDNVMSCYLVVLPLFIACLVTIFGRHCSSFLKEGFAVFFSICYGVFFMICTADTLYFGYFFKHLNASVFNWADEKGFVAEMLLKDTISFLFLILALVVPVLFFFLIFYLLRIDKRAGGKEPVKKKKSNMHYVQAGICSILILCLCVLGIRGRLAVKSPIRVGTACFSTNSFINELGLNPVFYFLRSMLDSQKLKKQSLSFLPDEEAIRTVREYFGIPSQAGGSPVAREKNYTERQDYNVVLILMEGIPYSVFEDEKTRAYIPFLDSLSQNSLFFDNCYSAGIHTMNGVCGSLFSYPALMQQHPFKSAEIQTMSGFPNVLRKNGYQTAYFTTHDDRSQLRL